MSTIDSSAPLVEYLRDVKESIVFEEMEQHSKKYEDKRFQGIELMIKQLDGSLIVPSFMDQRLIAGPSTTDQ